jgi:cytochrome c553
MNRLLNPVPPFQAALLCGLLFFSLAAPAAENGRGDMRGVSLAQALAASCANCHGTNGQYAISDSIPSLAGRPASWLREQMSAFRHYGRPSTVMQQIVRGYSEEEIALIAQWLEKQTPEKPAHPSEPEQNPAPALTSGE